MQVFGGDTKEKIKAKLCPLEMAPMSVRYVKPFEHITIMSPADMQYQ